MVRYDDLPVALLGSPGAMGRFRRRRSMSVEPQFILAFMAASIVALVGVGWLRRLIIDL